MEKHGASLFTSGSFPGRQAGLDKPTFAYFKSLRVAAPLTLACLVQHGCLYIARVYVPGRVRGRGTLHCGAVGDG
jgi:hypothetical protein